MVKRLSVSVSDELNARLQEVKSSLKISKICQDALCDAVDYLKAVKSNDPQKVTLLVSRLRKEKQKKLKPFYEEGLNDGQKDAFNIDLGQFEDFQYEQDLVDPFYPLDMLEMVASDLTIEKHETIYISSTYAEAKKELEEVDIQEKLLLFYGLIDGNHKKKGFYDVNDNPILSWDFLLLAKTYFEGWLAGMRTVLREVEDQLYKEKLS